MSSRTQPRDTGDEKQPLDHIRENREAVETLAEEESEAGATARYLLALADGETPDPRDARIADLPDLEGEL